MADADLRPMSLGEVLDRTFNLYKNNFWLFVGISALPFSLLFIVEVAVAAMGLAAGRVPGSQRGAVSAGLIGGAAVGALIVGLLYCLMISAAHAATVFAVADVYLSRTASIRGSFSRVGSKTSGSALASRNYSTSARNARCSGVKSKSMGWTLSRI